ncbi:MAG: hypothetical protein JXR37_23575 [Kiritimatiellae bacterium]|nr:hypothetical protein [Kiritimatiellia bacterium]
MKNTEQIRQFLERVSAVPVSVSEGGTGLNGVWTVEVGGKRVILKVYSRRRSLLRAVLCDIGYRLRGLTSFSASGRCRAERMNLEAWRRAGFETPRIIETPLPEPLPPNCLCLEFIDGPLLSSFLLDAAVPARDRKRVFRRFAEQWARRHVRAEQTGDGRLIHERSTFDHVFLCGDRFVTFDLEAAYVRVGNMRAVIAREICGYLRSVLKRCSEEQIGTFLDWLVDVYPNRAYLAYIHTALYRNPSLPARLVHGTDRALRRLRKQKMPKFEVAQRLRAALLRADAVTVS